MNFISPFCKSFSFRKSIINYNLPNIELNIIQIITQMIINDNITKNVKDPAQRLIAKTFREFIRVAQKDKRRKKSFDYCLKVSYVPSS